MSENTYLDVGLERWIYTTAKRHYWRVAHWYELEDLIQDGYLCYYKCLDKYGRLRRKRQPRKEDRRQFMTLVKKTFENHIHDLANRKTIQQEQAVSQLHGLEDTAEAWLERHGQIEIAMADFALAINQAPYEIKQLLKALASDGAAGIAYTQHKLKKHIQRETTNEHLCRLAGVNPKTVDMVEMLRQYFLVQAPR